MIRHFFEMLSVDYVTDAFMRLARAVLILAAAFILVRIIRSLIPALRNRFVRVMERHAGIEIPYSSRNFYLRGGQGVFAEAADRERMRQVVREVLAEIRSSPSRE